MWDPFQIPRLVVAAASSGSGKTTATVALIHALRSRGMVVAPFKCGPDYLDPTYLAWVAGRPCHNLDGWMMGRNAALTTFARGSRGADIAVIEGVMGLYDGASPTSEVGSTAEMAKWLSAPVLGVLDASGMARTVAALAHGLASHDPDLRLAGMICNRVGSRSHLELLRQALAAPSRTPSDLVPLLVGGLPSRPDLAFPERHLGLRRADEDVLSSNRLDTWGVEAASWLELDTIQALARSAPPLLRTEASSPPSTFPQGERCRIGVAWDEAFHFYYEDNLARLESLGAQLIRFSPVHDQQLPEVDGLYLGGGYPEEHAEAIAANGSMRRSVQALAAAGRPVYGECGGLMALCQAIRTRDGELRPMFGLLPGVAVMQERLAALGYVEVETRSPTPLGPAGLRIRGHQFRYSQLSELPDTLSRAYRLERRRGGETTLEGYSSGNVLGSYVHLHWASCPEAAAGFVAACANGRRNERSTSQTELVSKGKTP